jgi:hypothetical protein
MNDYGIRPGTLFGLDPEKGYYPNAADVYNPNLPGNGNSNYKVESKYPALLIFDFFIRIEMQILGRNVDGMKGMEAHIFIGFRHLQEDKFVTQLKH